MKNSYPNTEPFVSVIIPTYNHADFLKEAIDSVLSQSFKNWEIIVINNYSEDNTIDILNGFNDKRIKLINFGNEGVIAASRNVGLKNANGDYLAFLDSDDLWNKDKLKIQIETFTKYPELLIIGTNLETFPKVKKNALKIKEDIRVTFKKLLEKNYFINSSVLIKKEVVDHIGFLDEDKRLRAVEDYDFWLRILNYREDSGFVIKEDLIKYRIHNANLSGAGFNFDFLKSFEKEKIILEKYYDYDKQFIFRLIGERNRRCLKGAVKFKFYKREINVSQLFKNNEIKFLDKIEIIIKKSILSVLKSFGRNYF